MIRFNKPFYDGNEIKYAEEAINGRDFLNASKGFLQDYYSQKKIFLTCNGSSALDFIFLAMDLPFGSEVILPSFNFPSSANTILRMGLVPVFADISADTLVMDLNDVIKKTTDKTKCIVPIHYGGVSMDMNALLTFAKKRDIFVIEDAALSFDGEYKNKKLGTFGNASIISFHETKNISSIEGGAAIYNDGFLNDIAPIVFNNGTNREDFINKKVKWYSWQQSGINVGMSNVNGAILLAQLEKHEVILKKRKKIYDYYMKSLSLVSEKFNFKLPKIPEYNTNNYHVFYIIFESNSMREKVRLHLQDKKIEAHTHYIPLHLSPMGEKLGYKSDMLPITEDIAKMMLRLPLHCSLDEASLKYIIKSIMEIL